MDQSYSFFSHAVGASTVHVRVWPAMRRFVGDEKQHGVPDASGFPGRAPGDARYCVYRSTISPAMPPPKICDVPVFFFHAILRSVQLDVGLLHHLLPAGDFLDHERTKTHG